MMKQDELKFGDEFDALGDRLQALQDELTWHPCGSPQAALFMLGVASSLADDLRHAGEHGAKIEVESTYRAIDRLLDSLTAYVESTSGVKREDYRLEFFRSPGRDLPGELRLRRLRDEPSAASSPALAALWAAGRQVFQLPEGHTLSFAAKNHVWDNAATLEHLKRKADMAGRAAGTLVLTRRECNQRRGERAWPKYRMARLA